MQSHKIQLSSFQVFYSKFSKYLLWIFLNYSRLFVYFCNLISYNFKFIKKELFWSKMKMKNNFLSINKLVRQCFVNWEEFLFVVIECTLSAIKSVWLDFVVIFSRNVSINHFIESWYLASLRFGVLGGILSWFMVI